jgi:hypothetical protein
VAPSRGATRPTLREQTTQQARASTREVAPPRTTWWVPPHLSLVRRKERAHRGKGCAHCLYARDVQALLLCLIARYHAGTRPMTCRVRHDPHTVIHDAVADMLTGQTVTAVLRMRHPSGLSMKAWTFEGWTAMRGGRRR